MAALLTRAEGPTRASHDCLRRNITGSVAGVKRSAPNALGTAGCAFFLLNRKPTLSAFCLQIVKHAAASASEPPQARPTLGGAGVATRAWPRWRRQTATPQCGRTRRRGRSRAPPPPPPRPTRTERPNEDRPASLARPNEDLRGALMRSSSTSGAAAQFLQDFVGCEIRQAPTVRPRSRPSRLIMDTATATQAA